MRTQAPSEAFHKVAAVEKPTSQRQRARRQRKTVPVTLRMTKAERERLEELAVGMTLSAYIRACVLAEEQENRRKTRPLSVVADKRMAAEALALLGQSRIASNLNQLAYQANTGSLVIGDRERAKIEEAYEHILSIRKALLSALGPNK